jgi:hypothetical protein
MILWRKKISLLDQVYNHMDNAQKISWILHIKHNVIPIIPYLLARLSGVSKTFLLENHMKIFIYKKTFNFYWHFLRNRVCPFIKSAYINLTVNYLTVLKVKDSNEPRSELTQQSL